MSNDLLCECGHALRQHSAPTWANPLAGRGRCDYADCHCEKYRSLLPSQALLDTPLGTFAGGCAFLLLVGVLLFVAAGVIGLLLIGVEHLLK